MRQSREELLAKADEHERLALLSEDRALKRRHAILARYWLVLAGSVACELRHPAADEAA